VPLALTVYQYSVEQAKKKGSADRLVRDRAGGEHHQRDRRREEGAAPARSLALLRLRHQRGRPAHAGKNRLRPDPPEDRIAGQGVRLKFLDAAALLDEQEKSFGLFCKSTATASAAIQQRSRKDRGANAVVQKSGSITSIASSLVSTPAILFHSSASHCKTPPGSSAKQTFSFRPPRAPQTSPKSFQYLQSVQSYAKPGFFKFCSTIKNGSVSI